jgi:phosphoribosylformylglycinamidine synthase
VGGIMRDVFTMGARPIALPERAALRRSRSTRDDAGWLRAWSRGSAATATAWACRPVGGETQFHRGYNGNILVNAMCVGWPDADKIFLSAAAGPDLPVVYFGSKTGRDGIHGATMASAEFDDASEEKRPPSRSATPSPRSC